MEIFAVVVQFFQSGGVFMYPIAIVLVIGVAISIERWLVLTLARAKNRKAMDDIIPALRKGEYQRIVEVAGQSSVSIYRIVGAGLARLSHSNRRDDVEYAMEEGIMEAVPLLEKRTPYLAILANISTLLGLLGTIIGLIAAFSAVASADPAEKASLLSGSISLAMNTTAFGLISAIPLLLMHSLLQTKTSEIVDSLEMVGVKVLNIIGGQHGSRTHAQSVKKAPAAATS